MVKFCRNKKYMELLRDQMRYQIQLIFSTQDVRIGSFFQKVINFLNTLIKQRYFHQVIIIPNILANDEYVYSKIT